MYWYKTPYSSQAAVVIVNVVCGSHIFATSKCEDHLEFIRFENYYFIAIILQFTSSLLSGQVGLYIDSKHRHKNKIYQKSIFINLFLLLFLQTIINFLSKLETDELSPD